MFYEMKAIIDHAKILAQELDTCVCVCGGGMGVGDFDSGSGFPKEGWYFVEKIAKMTREREQEIQLA